MKIVYNGEKDSRQFKNVIGETVAALLEEDEKVVWLDADLMGCSGTKGLYGKNDRVVNCGIAEANMAGIAAGLSASGMKPYAHTFCYDQVFLAAGYAGNPITMIGTDPGITAAFNGGTHMPFEDVALYRALPEATIYDITDVPMLVDALKSAKDMPGVKYIRVPRKDSYQVYEEGTKFTPGKAAVLREGGDGVIVASGIMVHEALQAAEALSKDGIEMTVIDPVTIKPLDAETIRACAEKTGLVVAAENHNCIGGLTSAVQDAVCGMALKFGYVAVEDKFGEVGPVDYLRTQYDLTSDHIVRVVKGLK